MLEAYHVRLSDGHVLFLAIRSEPRAKTIAERLRNAGAIILGPGAWTFKGQASSLDLVDLIGELDTDDCVYVLPTAGGAELRTIMSQKTTGGIRVGD